MKGEDGLECVGVWVLWWCWEAQEFGELGKLGEKRVRRKEQVREGSVGLTREEGKRTGSQEEGIKAIGREGKVGMLTNNIMA